MIIRVKTDVDTSINQFYQAIGFKKKVITVYFLGVPIYRSTTTCNN